VARLAYVESDDGEWVGLYLDGHLVHEDDYIDNDRWVSMMRTLGIEVDTVYEVPVPQGGRFPLTLQQLRDRMEVNEGA